MKPPVVLAVLIGIIVLVIISGCATGSENQTLEERAKESYKHEFGPESGLRKHYKYLTPEFRSQCSDDEFVRSFMPLSLMVGKKYKIEVLRTSESGGVGTVVSRFVVEREMSAEEREHERSEKWVFVDGTWWNAAFDKDPNNLSPLDCQN